MSKSGVLHVLYVMIMVIMSPKTGDVMKLFIFCGSMMVHFFLIKVDYTRDMAIFTTILLTIHTSRYQEIAVFLLAPAEAVRVPLYTFFIV